MSIHAKTWLKVAVPVLAALLLLPGCNKLENNTESASVLLVNSITGNDLDGQDGSTVIFSDVITSGGGIINDNATASLSARLLDPGAVGSTYYQDVTVERIFIEYSRSDGLNVEGKDLPYSFSQDVHFVVPVGELTTEISFQIITHNAKLESPLVDLVNAGQEKILKLEAKVTFYSRDMAGNNLAPVSGTVSVWCANFADAEE